MSMLVPALSSMISTSISSAAIHVRAYRKSSDLVATLSAWFNGTEYSVQKAAFALDRVIVEFKEAPSISTVQFLSPMLLESADFQKNILKASVACDYLGEIANLNSLTTCMQKSSIPVALRGKEASSTLMHNVLMKSLSKQNLKDLIQSKVHCDASPQKQSLMIGVPVGCETSDTEPNLLKTYHAARRRSHDYFHMTLMNTPPHTPDASQCVGHFWYFIFFIILIPISLCLSVVFYRRGLESGKRSIRESENDIRAGVRLSLNPWSLYGMPPSCQMQYPPGYGYNNIAMPSPNQMLVQGSLPQTTTSSVHNQQIYGDGMAYQHQASWRPGY
ncbi:unnamed protein product [Phytomonas sp. Hart1]|nr:unnamed protein product [Phytomonas sp. Hart1]|eukprot:CCW66103.1 unnamed protein product [Phytomonas sp. isolate Hart1]